MNNDTPDTDRLAADVFDSTAPGAGAGLQAPDDRSAPGTGIGSIIAGVFGLVFVSINSAALPLIARVAVIVLAVLAVVAIIALARNRARQVGASGDAVGAVSGDADARPDPAEAGVSGRDAGARRSPFGRSYWVICGIEFLALFAGAQLLGRLGHPELGVAWVAVIVGLHFFPLGLIFRLRRFHLLAVIITICGVAGFGAYALGSLGLIPILSGVMSGFVLLAFGLWAYSPPARTMVRTR